MKRILRIAAAVVTGLGMSTGVVAAQSGSIGTTGPDSNNVIESRNRNSVHLNNRNDIRATNNNPQTARTGDARVNHNTTGGEAESGMASNDSMLTATVDIDNNSSAAVTSGNNGNDGSDARINNTGPDSNNRIESRNENTVRVNNNNTISVTNNNSQTAHSGNANVNGNTTGGDATSGDASNISTTDFSFSVNN